MLSGPISFVIFEPILGPFCVEFAHHPIARHFRQNGSGGDRGGKRVAFDDCKGRNFNRRKPVAVNEKIIGSFRQSGDRLAHREKRCLQNIDPVDRRNVYDPDAEARFGVGNDFVEEPFPA